jgi:hypothetical protein
MLQHFGSCLHKPVSPPKAIATRLTCGMLRYLALSRTRVSRRRKCYSGLRGKSSRAHTYPKKQVHISALGAYLPSFSSVTNSVRVSMTLIFLFLFPHFLQFLSSLLFSSEALGVCYSLYAIRMRTIFLLHYVAFLSE